VATAATTVGLPLPNRVSHTINAESLLNDATGLVAFKLAVAAAAAAGRDRIAGLHSFPDALRRRRGRRRGGRVAGPPAARKADRAGADDPVLQTLLAC
jgi:hypothetical protein